jgi:hypothetical protein
VIVQVAHLSYAAPFSGVAVCGAQDPAVVRPAVLRPAELERVSHDVATCPECVSAWFALQRP